MTTSSEYNRAFVTRILHTRRYSLICTLANTANFITISTIPGPMSYTVPPFYSDPKFGT
jgi:hypothetical protein